MDMEDFPFRNPQHRVFKTANAKRRIFQKNFYKTQNAPVRKTQTGAKGIINSIKLNCQFILIAEISRRWTRAFFDHK